MNARMAPQRCFIDKEHEGKEATAWPQSFYWSEKSPDGNPRAGRLFASGIHFPGQRVDRRESFSRVQPELQNQRGPAPENWAKANS
jgi:hypothetical protein